MYNRSQIIITLSYNSAITHVYNLVVVDKVCQSAWLMSVS